MRIHPGSMSAFAAGLLLVQLAVADAPACGLPKEDAKADSHAVEHSDETVTACVKTKLAANANTRDLRIDVHTENGVVKLSGEVWSAEERDLAGLLARNIEVVAMVRNELVVRGGR